MMEYNYDFNELLSILDNQLSINSEKIYTNYNKYVEQPEIGFYAKKNNFLADNLKWWNYVVENIENFGINTSLLSSNDFELLKERFIFFVWDNELAQIDHSRNESEKERKKKLKATHRRFRKRQEIALGMRLTSNDINKNIDTRNFNSKQKNELWASSGGYCSACGVKMTPFEGHSNSFEADHITAHSKGGSTNIYNGQALCRACNRKKSNS